MAALTPTDDKGLIDGSDSNSENYQYEVGANKSPSCLIEVEYHDGPNVAQWILDNEDNIASALAQGICSYLQVATPTSGAAVTTAALGGDVNSEPRLHYRRVKRKLSGCQHCGFRQFREPALLFRYAYYQRNV